MVKWICCNLRQQKDVIRGEKYPITEMRKKITNVFGKSNYRPKTI